MAKEKKPSERKISREDLVKLSSLYGKFVEVHFDIINGKEATIISKEGIEGIKDTLKGVIDNNI